MNQHEVVEKLETGFKKFNDKFTNLLEENQRIKQHNKNLQEKNQEISRTNLELNEKNQEISRTNLELNKKYQEISRNNSKLIEENEKILRINNDLKEKFQNINEQFEKLQKDLNLEKQKNKEIQRLEVISQNLEKNLKILEVDEIDINTINAFKENNEQKNCNINNNSTTFASNCSEDIRIVVGLDFGVTYSGFSYCYVDNDQNILTNCEWPGRNRKGKLQFATESEATAIYCLKDYFKCGIGETFMFVDCGKCTTDLTTRDDKAFQYELDIEVAPILLHHQVKDILVPALPEAAVARGAVIYGLSTMYDTKFDRLKCVISSRLLKYTYGVQYYWKSSDDLTHDGKNCKFKTLVKRDTEITPDQTFSFNFKPESKQISESFAIYYTQKHNIEGYCDEPGVNRLGILNIDLSDVQLDCRSIIFGLTFGKDEIIALARNELNRQEHMATFCYPDDDF
ncbi:unnamed protein product [Rhizophagus irregularis]|uniref:Uncharacterized protein n=2 Tax=Rhizophagus irregularis TaxID=588596 RepID=A0A916EEC5_9GLOM|nr:unnamed protein product [Rhizophagus irregularis]